jgi:hypothetical protein
MAAGTKETAAVRLSHDVVRELCGDILDWKIKAIIETGASIEELEEAIAFSSGQDDLMGEERKPLAGRVAEVCDILTADEDLGEEDRSP